MKPVLYSTSIYSDTPNIRIWWETPKLVQIIEKFEFTKINLNYSNKFKLLYKTKIHFLFKKKESEL